MSCSSKRNGRIGLGVIVAVLAGLGADAPSKSYKVSELTFDAPEAWKSEPPRAPGITQLQLVVAPAKGDEAKAVMTVSSGGGGVDANVRRWEMQFKDADENMAKADRKKVKGKNVEVTRIEISGHYFPPPFFNEKDKPNFRLLGAIVQTESTGYYFKMIGPDKTVAAARADFDRLIASLSSAAEK